MPNNRPLPRYSLLEKSHAFKVAWGAAHAAIRAFNVEDKSIMIDFEAVCDELSIPTSSYPKSKETDTVTAIMSGPPYRRQWLKPTGNRFDPPDEVVTMANKVFVGTIVAMLPHPDVTYQRPAHEGIDFTDVTSVQILIENILLNGANHFEIVTHIHFNPDDLDTYNKHATIAGRTFVLGIGCEAKSGACDTVTLVPDPRVLPGHYHVATERSPIAPVVDPVKEGFFSPPVTDTTASTSSRKRTATKRSSASNEGA